MSLLALGTHDLHRALDRSGLMKALGESLKALSLGQARNFSRTVYALDGEEGKSRRAIGFMPATLGDRLVGYKAASVFHDNQQHGLNPHQGLVVLLDPKTGEVRAVVEASTLTALRTAAVSALATDRLARRDSQTLTLVGTGRQAYEHALFIANVRELKRIIIYGRAPSAIQALQRRLEKETSAKVESESDIAKALAETDIIATCTASREPHFELKLVPKGAHLNAIGASRPGQKEVRLQTVPGLKIYLDSREACLREASEIIDATQTGELDPATIVGELGAMLAEQIPGRKNPDEITVFKSVGLGLEDVAAAEYFLERAQTLGIAHHLEF